MSRVLFLAYHFPPIGGAGAQRPAKLAKYLSRHGCEATVLTGPGDAVGRWTPRDTSLAASTPPDLPVIRVDGPEPQGHPPLRSRAERWLWIEAPWTRWWIRGASAAGIAPARGVDAIYAFMSPWASAAVAMNLSAATGRPWIADLGDPWALDEMTLYPTGVHRAVELGRMRRALRSAAAIVVTAPEAGERIRRAFPELHNTKIVTIPNGFDGDDFEGPVATREDDAFRIVHSGYLHTDLGRQQRRTAFVRRLLRGQSTDVNILTRSHVYLLQAIERLEPGVRNQVEVHLAGVLSDGDRSAATDRVRLHGYLPHDDSLALIRSADMLFLPMQNLPAGERASIVPGKTYEYLATGRPILAAVPDGDARDILAASGTARLCRPDDVPAMARIVQEEVRKRRPSHTSRPESADRFEYRNLAALVAEAVREVAPPVGRARPAQPAHAFDLLDRQKTVLWLAYYFPPIGGAGTQRSLKFVRYLPDHDWRAIVVTGRGSSGGRWAPADASLVAEIPPEVEVARLSEPEPEAATGWRERSERWLSARSAWTRWWVDGATAVGLARTGEVDVIYASMSPYVSADAAATLSRELGRPWVAGLRDPWALDEMMVFPTGVHRRLEMRRMRRSLASASAIVVTAAEAAARIRRAFPELASIPIAIIPNGFDSDDFDGLVAPREDAAFRIVHSGYLHTDLGRRQHRTASLRRLLGGQYTDVDILTRSHVYLLEAIERLESSLRRHVELHLAGVLSEGDRAAATDVVRMHGYVPHHESVALIRSADLLFLPMQNLPEGVRASIVPGKTYEYLATGKPILAAVPEGDARDILAAAGTARICRPDDVSGMAQAIAGEIRRWQARTPASSANRDYVQRFERRRLTADIASVFDGVLKSSPAHAPRRREPALR